MKTLKYLTAKQVAEKLGISQQAIYLKRITKRIESKDIIKIGNRYYYSPAIIDKFKGDGNEQKK